MQQHAEAIATEELQHSDSPQPRESNTIRLFSIYENRAERSKSRHEELDEVRQNAMDINLVRVKRNERRLTLIKFSIFTIGIAYVAMKFI